MALGDFDKDGDLDAVLAHGDAAEMSMLLGNGDGTFQQPIEYAAGPSSLSAAVARDFDRDGRLDIVVANLGGDGVSFLRGHGDGSFQAPATYAAGPSPYALAAADFNRDGRIDMAVLNRFEGAVRVVLGNGNGSFQAPTGPHSVGGLPYTLAAGDVNGDGFPDVAAASFSATAVAVLLNDSDWTRNLPDAGLTPGTGPGGFPSSPDSIEPDLSAVQPRPDESTAERKRVHRRSESRMDGAVECQKVWRGRADAGMAADWFAELRQPGAT